MLSLFSHILENHNALNPKLTSFLHYFTIAKYLLKILWIHEIVGLTGY